MYLYMLSFLFVERERGHQSGNRAGQEQHGYWHICMYIHMNIIYIYIYINYVYLYTYIYIYYVFVHVMFVFL